MKKAFLLALLTLFTLLPSLSAQESSEIAAWVCPEGYAGQTLSIFNWSTYIADDTVPNFETLCGVTVNYDIFESNESMLARIRQGNPGYDIIFPTDYMIATMSKEGLLVPLNHELIPNIANLTPSLMNKSYDPENVYSLPYQWGTIGFGYNTEVFPDGIDSWEQLWAHDGAVAWLDDRRGLIGTALMLLGYEPNSSNADEIAEARDYLIERGGNVKAIAADDGQVLLERGEVDVTIEYSGDIFALADECECETFAYTIPKEGGVLWVDNMAIPVDAPNADLAMVFMDYVLHPQVGADISNYTAYASPNQAAIDAGLIDEAYLSDPGIYPSEETLANLFTIDEVDADTEELYNNAWDEMLIFLGQ